MSSEFEKEIQDKMDGFRLAPRPEVWSLVEAALPGEKRKRRIAFWWWLPIGLLLAGGTWWLVSNNKSLVSNAPQSVNSATPAEKTSTPKEKITLEPTATALQQTTTDNGTKPTIIRSKKNINTPVTISKKDKSNIAIKDVGIIKAPRKPAAITFQQNGFFTKSKKPGAKTEEAAIMVASGKTVDKSAMPTTANNGRTDKKATALSKMVPQAATKETLPGYPENDSVQTVKKMTTDTLAIETNMLAKPDTAAIKYGLAHIVDPIVKKSITKWRLLAGFGTSNTSLSLPGSSNALMEVNNFASNPIYNSPANGIAYNFGAAQKAKVGATFHIAIERSQAISEHWSWTAGLRYAYLSNTQATGSRKDSIINAAQFTSADKALNIYSFYYPGGLLSHTNHVHALGLQGGFRYTVKPTSKRPLSLDAGLTANTLLGNTQLIYSPTKNIFFYAPSQLPSIVWGARLGFDWQLWHRLAIGLDATYDFTRVANPSIARKSHWHTFNAHISIPLGK